MRQCRERYKNYLSPRLSTGPWSDSEDELLKLKVAEFGPKWAKIAYFFTGRSDVSLKNHWAAISGRDRRVPRQSPVEEKSEVSPPALAPFKPGSPRECCPIRRSEPSLPLPLPPIVPRENVAPKAPWLWSGAEPLSDTPSDVEERMTTFPNHGGRVW
jgi:hypothetical protein